MDKLYLPEKFNSEVVRIDVVGVGGSGGEFIDGLHRIQAVLKELGHKGFKIRIFDPKKVGQQNIGRTRFSQNEIGMYKTDVIASKYNLAFGLEIESHPYKYEIKEHIFDFDLLITCSDSAKLRCVIGEHSEKIRNGSKWDKKLKWWLDLGNTDTSAQYVLGNMGCNQDDKFVPNIYDLYKDSLLIASQEENDKSSCSLLEAVELQSLFINRTVADHSLSLLYEWFKGSISTHGGFIDLKTHMVKPLKIDRKIWDFLMGNSATSQ